MPSDLHGLPITTASAEAAAAFDRTLIGYFKYRADTAKQLAAALEADEDFALAHILRGYFMLLAFDQNQVAAAAEAARAAHKTIAGATPREQQHLAALEAWIAGDLERTIGIWEEILVAQPLDVLAFRLAHFNNFWLGRPAAMRASIDRIESKWSPQLPGYGTLLSCKCFAWEECGEYAVAEPAGRKAVEIDPEDLWGTHALAHVMEMQGRSAEGIAFLGEMERHWEGANNLAHHLWWHRALFHYERREFEAVLGLYDRRFRNLASPLTQAQPDLYIDVQNAAAMLFRLERQGVDVGARWVELADKAEARIGDCRSAFTLPHWMMALAACGRDAAAARMLQAMRAFGDGKETLAPIVRDVATPICEAVLAHRKGEAARALERMRPVLETMHCLGGSHAQQDVLLQLYLDAALQANRVDDLRRALVRAARDKPLPLAERVGYAAAEQALA
ncbi:MAG TPA: tetratricopeptide repeat protein [Burkholderiales bacterium]|nr:tetratricopeptide repeat protein [Burkholderiales bacterium]